jgi:hypothetical protein
MSRKSTAERQRDQDALLISVLNPEWVERFYRLTLEINTSIRRDGGIRNDDRKRMRPIIARQDLYRESHLGDRFWEALIRSAPEATDAQ